ncbi:MAG: FHA domain-containing protein [Cyanobacteriota bacterium]|nr:FHA domain-containing protein [Cyanobacteriota bacterium]
MNIKAFNPETGDFHEKNIIFADENPSKCLIGRHPNCDFILNSPEVSRVHGMIIYQQSKYYYIDLASTDGSRVNTQNVAVNQSLPLQSGDAIKIGDFLILVEFEEQNLLSDDELFFNSETLIAPAQYLSSEETELTIRCTKIIEETGDVKTFCFVAEPPILFNEIPFNYKPGQFVILNLNIRGKKVKHAYSISSSPSRPYNLQITIKRVSAPNNKPDLAPSLVSNWLHDYFKIGDKLKVSLPMGDFNYFDNSYKNLLFVCAGSGISPLISMCRWLCDTDADISVHLIYSARTQQDIIFREELELMSLKYSNFDLSINLTSKEFDLTWTGYRGRLNEKMLLEMAPDFKERIAYVCGSDSFLESVKNMLQELKFPMHNYYQESLGIAKITKSALISNYQNLISKG